ncbi:MAG: hypothetical protein KQJ78_17710 [Deltaproteobacteria bacterium]|nr:hypothetical protein [Deltaproteobacteria bacterium]
MAHATRGRTWRLPHCSEDPAQLLSALAQAAAGELPAGCPGQVKGYAEHGHGAVFLCHSGGLTRPECHRHGAYQGGQLTLQLVLLAPDLDLSVLKHALEEAGRWLAARHPQSA